MRKSILTTLKVSAFALMAGLVMTSCASSHCPAVAGTGNSASAGHRGAKKKYCAGVKGTGTIKPKRKKRIEDGNFDPKMEKAKARAEKKNTSPIKKKKLSIDG